MSDRPETADKRHPDLKTYAVRLERSRSEGFEEFDRAEKYRALRSASEEVRRQIAQWVEAEGLVDEIVELGDPTAFSLLFVKSTAEGAQRLRDAPGVVSVVEDPEFPLDLGRTR